MTKYEYDKVVVYDFETHNLVEILDSMGHQGWELVASNPYDDEGATIYFFKRPIEEEV